MKKVYSYSKRSVLDRCVRQYFYEYYAGSYEPPRTEPQRSLFDDPSGPTHSCIAVLESATAKACKSLSSAFQCAGQVLHNIIAQHWKNRDWQPEWFMRTALRRFDQTVSMSRACPVGGVPTQQRLLEHYYGLLDAEQTVASAREKLVKAVTNYFHTTGISGLVSDLLSGDEAHAEDSIAGLPKIGDFTICGRIDGWSRNGPRIRIVDWKMGTSAGEEESLQLALYGWWATERFHALPQLISAQRVFLGDAAAEQPLKMSERLIDRCRARLRKTFNE